MNFQNGTKTLAATYSPQIYKYFNLSQLVGSTGRAEMEQSNYHLCFQEALAKAISAKASNVRDAYLDLADFYRRKLGGNLSYYPSHEELGHRSVEQRLAA